MQKVLRSLQLDWSFLLLDISLDQKIEFLYKKYLVLMRNVLFKPQAGVTYITLWGEKYYYDDIYGLAVLQSAYCDNGVFKKFIRPQGTIIDIGANIGQFNHFSRHYLHAKTVVSFEPVAATYSCLIKNAKKNTFNFAISTKSSLQFYLPSLSVWATSQKQAGAKEEKVKGVRLDTFPEIQKLKNVDLLKIDVEGAEKDVLLASKRTIQKTKYILIEVSFERAATADAIDLLHTLKEIAPKIKLIKIGRLYDNEDTTTGAGDLLFLNE